MAQDSSAEQAKRQAKDRFILRFHSEGERAAFKERAARNKRTMNAELLYLLEAGAQAVDGARRSEHQ